MSSLVRVKPRWSRFGVTKGMVLMAGLPGSRAMVEVCPPLLAKAAKRGSAELAMVPLKLVAVRIRLLIPEVFLPPKLIVLATKSVIVGLVVLWPTIVLLIDAVAVAPSPKT